MVLREKHSSVFRLAGKSHQSECPINFANAAPSVRSRLAKSASRASLASRQSRRSAATTVNGGVNGGVSYRQQAPMLNDKYFPR